MISKNELTIMDSVRADVYQFAETGNSVDYLFDSLIPFIQVKELLIVAVNHNNMQIVFNTYKSLRLLKKYEKGYIKNYISFSRFKGGLDKIMCDWCSIVNGTFELILDAVLEVCDDKDTILKMSTPEWSDNDAPLFISNFNNLDNKLYSSASCGEEDLKPFTEKLDNLDISEKERIKIISEITKILHVKDALRQIEQRWCPFKHMKKLKYNRDYYIYNSHNTEEVQSAVDTIKQHGKLTLKNSSKKIPSNDMTYTKGLTPFNDFMKYIEDIIIT